MPRRKPVLYKDLGLEIALVFAKYLFHTEYLHYGYWTPGLEVTPQNLLQAQENYCKLLLANIPEGTRTILDVGCGTGKFTEELLQAGYQVDDVSPSALLTRHARNRLGDNHTIFETRYEDLRTDRRYDLILFSESFQYIPLRAAFEKSQEFLEESGHLLICDFFEITKDDSPLSGGHALWEFEEARARHQFTVLSEIDITAETAPNLDLVNEFYGSLAIPVYRSLSNALRQNHPTFYRILTWIYRKRLAKLRWKYTGNARTAATFRANKSYRLIVCQKPATLSRALSAGSDAASRAR